MRFVVLAFVALLVPGCLDGADGPRAVGSAVAGDYDTRHDLGALQAVFRDPDGDALSGGFVLLEPIGLTATTDDDGAVAFVDLDPGVYRLKFQLDGYEASPRATQVNADAWTREAVEAVRTHNQ